MAEWKPMPHGRAKGLAAAHAALAKRTPEERREQGRRGAVLRWERVRAERAREQSERERTKEITMAITQPMRPGEHTQQPEANTDAAPPAKRKSPRRMTRERAVEVAKKLAEVIDKTTRFYPAGSGYTDERVALELGVSHYSVRTLRVELYGIPRGIFQKNISRMNYETERHQQFDALTEQIGALIERISALQGRVEELETALYGSHEDDGA